MGNFRYNLQILSLSTAPVINLEVGESSRLLLEHDVQLVAGGGAAFTLNE